MGDRNHDPSGADLDSPEQIAELVRRFYADVAQDELLGPLFNDVARVDWSEHLPKLTAFWCRALLGQAGYTGNPFQAHAHIHAQRPFTAAHFVRWLSLFHETVELGWSGPNADRALELADNVARVHSNQLVGHPVSLAEAPGGAARTHLPRVT
ncbi:group III truncated hemoglobin [Rhabdothermincola salaria]|uniref:group III truncated hemoglobin n=1 Tax=Rhabdothermincola salaria TaxID=2903142 RepID=UPI001E641108|nr:group III truncated hemoglobin [Rhabdothermincola salaria]MCD9622264.1 group III truncated hemoglobin [Rhabdothermincola salaria]